MLAIALLCFLLGLPLLTKVGAGGRGGGGGGGVSFLPTQQTFLRATRQRGLNLFTIVDVYGVHVVMLLFVALFEIVSVAWLYGATPPR